MKILYILSDLGKSVAFEWISEHFENSDVQIDYLLINSNQGSIVDALHKYKGSVYEINSIALKNVPKMIFRARQIIRKGKYNIVHCHLMKANLIGLPAAKLAGVKHRIYTRHHSTFHKQYAKKWVMVDRLMNSLSTEVVAISKNVEKTLLDEGVGKKKIRLIHHGFKLDEFTLVDPKRVDFLMNKYDIPKDAIVLGVVSRYIVWKGINYIIEAFKELLKENKNYFLILANAKGVEKIQIQNMLEYLPNDRFCEIEFEDDLFALYRMFDVYIHVPIDSTIEAFGQTYIEALIAGIPSVFSLSGVAHEFIKNKRNAIVVDYQNSAQIIEGVKKCLENKESLKLHGSNSIRNFKEVHLSTMMNKLEKLYLKNA